MLTTAIGLRECDESNQVLLEDLASELEDEEADISGKILYMASFEELEGSHVIYDTVVWVLISLLLVLAWGVGILMLLYLPFKRYILRKDIHSRKLYVTCNEIVYKAKRPSFLPFWGFTTIEKHIPLPLVIDVIIEQGCLQTLYGIHTFRVESVAHGKAAHVDELQIQGVWDPGLLRKVIVTEAANCMQEIGASKKPMMSTSDGEPLLTPTGSIIETQAIGKPQPPNWKATPSPRRGFREGFVHTDVLLHKLEEVEQSVKKIESIVERSQSKKPQDGS
ncbi:hypothetical protein AMTRI_Chr07g31040 [Amborella trichopoda]|uniref:DUF7642 domain-containing protein n=1 Tax=Amborella trichopoda TaxID=13333 RepID=W1NI68_AMBTC|nr:uncharacterized protein LOC18423082 [Amborella trichopoda]XP_020527621.1 uncharacterized protein LOC18423082 [Amborella trichopoda]XP_020527628.1 uncharacterized protein LOC18423082 [Amborella trichopoda]XP_020527635.1 uncharacterized protein LOC18423082 [Amborella trichopoda]ERM95151.1 hypothetical protein AMTR_s00009p00261800 [Amborella trichopoda]|eukprot:XP_006827735.1 uncharacterized protein LOC18423082 [Amborella trichopoda]